MVHFGVKFYFMVYAKQNQLELLWLLFTFNFELNSKVLSLLHFTFTITQSTSTWTLTVTKLSNHSKWVKKATFNEFLFNNLKVNKSCLKSGSQVLVLMIGAPAPASGWAQLTLYNIYQWLMTLHSLLSALTTSPQVVHRSFFIDFQNLHPFTDKCSVFRWVNFDQNRLNILVKPICFVLVEDLVGIASPWRMWVAYFDGGVRLGIKDDCFYKM